MSASRGWPVSAVTGWLASRDAAIVLLVLTGLAFACVQLATDLPAFDDHYLPARFADLVTRYGYLKAVGIILTGMDMANEYRTYGGSRLLHFALWLVAGYPSLLYALFMALSQLASAIALLVLLRDAGVNRAASLAAAMLWLVSPFAVNSSFHHYSYLILPFQLLIATALVLSRIQAVRGRFAIAAALGIACALTGEMHLLALPVVLLALALRSGSRARLRLTFVTLAAVAVTLATHWGFWKLYVQQVASAPRWTLKPTGGSELLSRVVAASASALRSAEVQVQEILRSGYAWWLVTAIVVGLGYWAAVALPRHSSAPIPSDRPASPIGEGRVAAFMLVLGMLSVVIFVALATATGLVPQVMARRYGFVPLTFFLMALALGIAWVLRPRSMASRAALLLMVAATAGASGQLFYMISRARAVDADLGERMQAAQRGSASTVRPKGLVLYVAADPGYALAAPTSGTVGPLRIYHQSNELLQSPFALYWTAQHYGANALGFRFVSMLAPGSDKGSPRFGGNPYPANPGAVPGQDVVVMANLAFDPQDARPTNVKIFPTFTEFEPHYFGRAIHRDALSLQRSVADEIVIDLGRPAGGASDARGALPDKRFAEPTVALRQPWVENYGLLSGPDASFAHPGISDTQEYFKTNRHGVFTYGVSFRAPIHVEVSLDFWEQWGRRPGERTFTLEVSWDGVRWAEAGTIDPAALNGDRPVSVVLTRSGAKVFQFRMKPVPGAKDVPFVQGMRIRKL